MLGVFSPNVIPTSLRKSPMPYAKQPLYQHPDCGLCTAPARTAQALAMEPGGRLECPCCHGPIYRIPRLVKDRLIGLILPRRRYRCEVWNCWEGTLPVVAARTVPVSIRILQFLRLLQRRDSDGRVTQGYGRPARRFAATPVADPRMNVNGDGFAQSDNSRFRSRARLLTTY